jgi:hypothetical protein
VRALGELVRLHPELLARHGLAVRHHVARHFATQCSLRRAGAAAETLLENGRVPEFRFSPAALVYAYRRGRVIRRQMMRVGMRGAMPGGVPETRPACPAVNHAA